jgi:hypothetical protein
MSSASTGARCIEWPSDTGSNWAMSWTSEVAQRARF